MNQKKMQITFRVVGEVNNGDIVQCPLCRKKFVVIPGLIRYRLDDHREINCSCCAKPTDAAYYEQVSRGDLVELPPRRGRKKEEV